MTSKNLVVEALQLAQRMASELELKLGGMFDKQIEKAIRLAELSAEAVELLRSNRYALHSPEGSLEIERLINKIDEVERI